MSLVQAKNLEKFIEREAIKLYVSSIRTLALSCFLPAPEHIQVVQGRADTICVHVETLPALMSALFHE